ncbi:hypothetical protein VF14_31855 [Nostoc linckia z18]|uniref:Uncharacterized protein n=3 Tax=Nostoc linckia TaxID=92942 RepID=A0A9Q5Z5U6_NOSLI|nr:hypothetical protein VF02_35470 [Nostoc linckia z1]PHJ57005.1 hypothetical protein VF05_36490 [Nostoc linckia z3]PHJ58299.1 hypothetical protein VF03_35675 [Nostoc linckia z2]PHJ73079.1 hypothetical protein VF06_36265 [Nostoc linckia z4]PHJ77326.1 hypothetical protein VF07_36195 [Nostoc linckia z6]PHJ88754.1 hypothetical protein VF04_33075 [Nostoc linckia z7]PHJ95075.1 hypothetical protein VF08_32690 [Nostoc linckia z8]PHK03094.1 hypothetical protein VF09_30540 [Nostoc linckia z9]PHK1452
MTLSIDKPRTNEVTFEDYFKAYIEQEQANNRMLEECILKQQHEFTSLYNFNQKLEQSLLNLPELVVTKTLRSNAKQLEDFENRNTEALRQVIATCREITTSIKAIQESHLKLSDLVSAIALNQSDNIESSNKRLDLMEKALLTILDSKPKK